IPPPHPSPPLTHGLDVPCLLLPLRGARRRRRRPARRRSPTMSAPDGQILAGRFDLVRLLKSSQGVETHLGVDRSSGKQVVVKLVTAGEVPLAVRLRLQHE